MESLTLVDRNGAPLAALAAGGTIVVGRSAECDVCLADPTVSRRHAEVQAAGDEIVVRDLGSRNGTFRNGVRVETARLRAGDVVSFGVCAVRVQTAPRLTVMAPSGPAVAPPRARARGGIHTPRSIPIAPYRGGSVQRVPESQRDEAASPESEPTPNDRAPQPDGVAAGGPAGEPGDGDLPVVAERPGASPHDLTARRLGLLLDVTKALGRATGGASLVDQVVLHAVQTTDADRAALLVGSRDVAVDAETLRPAVARDRWGGDLTGGAGLTVPRSILRAAVVRRTAVLSVDAAIDPRFGGESVLRQRVRSAICAPLLGSDGQPLGVLYVDSASPTHTFGEEDLDYLTAFAGVAAAAIENARLGERVRAELVARQNFERYFAPPVAERIARLNVPAAPGGERRTVAVLFADLRGSTRVVASMAPDEVASTLSEFLGAMVDCVFRHDGTLDKFIGDAVMAQWGAPEGTDDDAGRAMRAASDMMDALARLNARWRVERPDRPQLAMGIGIAYGEVFAGNIGSERRLEFTVIGEAVNQASRLCDAASPGEILVSDAFRDALRDPPPMREVPTPYAHGRTAAFAVVPAP